MIPGVHWHLIEFRSH